MGSSYSLKQCKTLMFKILNFNEFAQLITICLATPHRSLTSACPAGCPSQNGVWPAAPVVLGFGPSYQRS